MGTGEVWRRGEAAGNHGLGEMGEVPGAVAAAAEEELAAAGWAPALTAAGWTAVAVVVAGLSRAAATGALAELRRQVVTVAGGRVTEEGAEEANRR